MLRPCLSVAALLLGAVADIRAGPPQGNVERLPPGAVARLGSPRLRHTADVLHVVFAPDGRTLYAAGPEKAVRAWNVATGLEVRRFVHENSVYRLALSPDGKSLAAGDGDTTIRVWDPATGTERCRIDTQQCHFALAFTPDGRTLFGGGGPLNPVISRWDALTGKKLPDFARHKEFWTQVLAFSPDGKTLATSETNELLVWDVATGQRKYRVPTGTLGGINGLMFSPDGRQLVGACGDTVLVWEAATGKRRHRIQPREHIVGAAAFSPDGRSIAAGMYRGTLRLWDAATGEELRVFKGHTKPIRAVAFSPDGRTLATGSEDQTVRLWNVATGRERLPVSGPEARVDLIAFAPDGRTVATAGEDHVIRLWHPGTGKELRRLVGLDRDILQLAFAPDSRWLASGDRGGTVRLWDPRTGREILQGRHHGAVIGLSFSPDGRALASGGYSDATIKLWDVPAQGGAGGKESPQPWKERRQLQYPRGRFLLAVVFASDGRRLVGVVLGEPLRVWDLRSGELQGIGDPDHPVGSLASVSLAADGRTLVGVYPDSRGGGLFGGGAEQGRVWRWDLHTGKDGDALRPEKGSAVSILRGAVAPNGRSVATVGKDGIIRLWELATGQQRRQWSQAGEGEATAIAFGPDSRILAVANADRTVLLWDTHAAAPAADP